MINLNTSNKLPEKIKLRVLASFIIFSAPSLFWPFWIWISIVLFLPINIIILFFYNSVSFMINDDKITINQGIIRKSSKSIPFDTIQNVENVSGITDRFFGLCTVSIWTSSPEQISAQGGTTYHAPDGSLPLIAEDADWLKNFILSKKNSIGKDKKLENNNFSVADELIKLKDLLDKGIITQEEFDAQKKKILM